MLNFYFKEESIRYVLVGIYNTAFGYFLFTASYWLVGGFVHYSVIAVLTHPVAVSHSFLMQRWLVFRDKGPWRKKFIFFHAGYASSLPLGVLLLAGLHEYFKISIYWAQLLSFGIIVAYSFIVSRYLVFRS
jgi:putative flippase GtrA